MLKTFCDRCGKEIKCPINSISGIRVRLARATLRRRSTVIADAEYNVALCDDCCVDPSTICQHTGCPDSKGNPIFESNRVTYEMLNGATHQATVVYRDAEFCLDFDDMSYVQHGLLCAESSGYFGTLKVIGNIHDAPKEANP